MADVSPAPAPGGRRILGLPPRVALIGGAVILAAVGYLLWKRRQASSAGSAAATSASAATGTDYGGELSTIQSELESLLAAEGNEPGGTSGGGGGTTTTGGPGSQPCPGGFRWDPVQGKCVPGLGEGPVPSSGSGSGGGGGGKKAPGTPTGVHATKVTPSAVTLAWNKAPNATSYRLRATYQGRLVGSQQTVNGTAATVSGLHPDHTYTMHVAAVGPGGTSGETNGPAVKTSR